jgi:hypothetical protein
MTRSAPAEIEVLRFLVGALIAVVPSLEGNESLLECEAGDPLALLRLMAGLTDDQRTLVLDVLDGMLREQSG